MTAPDRSAAVAHPGDPDLDLDVTNLTITAVISDPDDQEALIHFRGGTGWFVESTTGSRVRMAPGEVRDTSTNVRVRLPAMDQDAFSDYVAQLEQWRDNGTPVRMCSAPGKVTLLIENRDTYVLIPRRPDPLETP